jgi:hypothetical protein
LTTLPKPPLPTILISSKLSTLTRDAASAGPLPLLELAAAPAVDEVDATWASSSVVSSVIDGRAGSSVSSSASVAVTALSVVSSSLSLAVSSSSLVVVVASLVLSPLLSVLSAAV